MTAAASVSSSAKRRVRRLIDRIVLPYVDQIRRHDVAQDPTGFVVHTGPVVHPSDVTPQDAVSADDAVTPGEPELPSDFFHLLNHELRTLELERVPKGARHALSVGPEGRWFFEWFERSVGPLERHIGIEAFTPRPDDLPEFVSWIPDTADRMIGVADDSIDLVFGGQTSEHLWEDELIGFLLEAHRVLRGDGLLVLDSPNRLVTQHLAWSHGGHTIELSAAEMASLLTLAGFAPGAPAGVWNCIVGGRVLQLEEGVTDPTVLARRIAEGRERPDECFVWWINSRRLDVEPDVDGLSRRVHDLFAEHWDTRVCRGLVSPDADALRLDRRGGGQVGSTLPFPLRAGVHTITVQLVSPEWSQVRGFRLDLVAAGGHLQHSLDLESAELQGDRATWTFEQPWLVFAVALEVHVADLDDSVVLRMPFHFGHSSPAVTESAT